MKVIGYLRVSTGKQGESGLGLEAQQTAIENFVRQRNACLMKTFTEIEAACARGAYRFQIVEGELFSLSTYRRWADDVVAAEAGEALPW